MMNAIIWDVNPEIFPNLLPVRWYGLLFAIAFLLGYEIFKRSLKKENAPEKWVDTGLIYAMVGIILGARLGHVFFYDWEYYQNHIPEIIMIWKGGLASHGAAIGSIVSLYIMAKKVTKTSLLWLLDRAVIAVAPGGALVRLGNLMNSEIIGKPTGSDWGFVFTSVDMQPRYPTQLMEALCYGVIFYLLWFLFFKRGGGKREGLLFGTFLTSVFIARFCIEFWKENQVTFEDTLPLNMGQILSIPLIFIGVFFIYRSKIKAQNG